ncbi:MAG: AAA family ATPase [Brevundimonas sp.]
MNAESTSLAGRLMKVVRFDASDERAWVRLQDGRTASLNTYYLNDVSPGDVLLVDEDGRPQPAPAALWVEPTGVAVVRRLETDGSVLLDTGSRIIPVRNELAVAVAVGNTIEFNDAEGVVRVISQTPIRSGDPGLDTADIRSEFLVPKSTDGARFEDFGGFPHVVARARELIETQIDQRDRLRLIGARPVKGVLFAGPPGTGKTHLARIIAQEADAEFYLVNGPSIVSKWVGDTEGVLRRLFAAAGESASGRSIIFFDEIDSLAERRTSESHEFSKRLVAQLLTLMDGFDSEDRGVLVIAATNRPEDLDPAVTRPGRFDWVIEFGLPTLADRIDILSAGSRGLKTEGDLPIVDVAVMTAGWSAADLNAVWREAALLAVGDRRDLIAAEDVALACERISALGGRNTAQEIRR